MSVVRVEVRYCEVCAWVDFDHREKCPFCGALMNSVLLDTGNYIENKDKIIQRIFDVFVSKSSRYKPVLKERREQLLSGVYTEPSAEVIAASSSIKKADVAVHCPKCGSSQIQMVPRKWSFFTGFLTSKVDRVCVNCKHRF